MVRVSFYSAVFVTTLSKNGGKETGTVAYHEYSFNIFQLIIV